MRIPEEKPPTPEAVKQAEENFLPSKWWQAVDADGKMLMETSSIGDFKTYEVDKQEGVTFRHLYEKKTYRWVEENPFQ